MRDLAFAGRAPTIGPLRNRASPRPRTGRYRLEVRSADPGWYIPVDITVRPN